mmetsp:Transcript_13355/g.30458  ORF Transcript_13355/g.30458 Transcript_13355/m.30458 type:complete len:207 (-) Transcript_13355:312-932(-)
MHSRTNSMLQNRIQDDGSPGTSYKHFAQQLLLPRLIHSFSYSHRCNLSGDVSMGHRLSIYVLASGLQVLVSPPIKHCDSFLLPCPAILLILGASALDMRPSSPPEARAVLHDRLCHLCVPEVKERCCLAPELYRQVSAAIIACEAQVQRLVHIPDEVDQELHLVSIREACLAPIYVIGRVRSLHELPVEVPQGLQEAPVFNTSFTR